MFQSSNSLPLWFFMGWQYFNKWICFFFILQVSILDNELLLTMGIPNVSKFKLPLQIFMGWQHFNKWICFFFILQVHFLDNVVINNWYTKCFKVRTPTSAFYGVTTFQKMVILFLRIASSFFWEWVVINHGYTKCFNVQTSTSTS